MNPKADKAIKKIARKYNYPVKKLSECKSSTFKKDESKNN